MAVLDPSRLLVEFSPEELEAAAALLTDGIVDAGVLEALEAAGVVRNRTIVPYVARLLSVVAAPKLRIVVERYVGERPIVESVWAIERLAVWGSQVRGGGTELRPVEPAVLPMEIVRAVGLGPRPSPAIDTPLQASAATFERLEELLPAGDLETAAVLLAEEGLDELQRAVLIKLMLDRRSSWRVSTLWTDAGGERSEIVSVVDAGNSGLWITTITAPDDGETTICLEPAMPSTAWDRIVDLMPWAEDEQAPPDALHG